MKNDPPKTFPVSDSSALLWRYKKKDEEEEEKKPNNLLWGSKKRAISETAKKVSSLLIWNKEGMSTSQMEILNHTSLAFYKNENFTFPKVWKWLKSLHDLFSDRVYPKTDSVVEVRYDLALSKSRAKKISSRRTSMIRYSTWQIQSANTRKKSESQNIFIQFWTHSSPVLFGRVSLM